jgi:putative ATP-dependent endonuclease of OLD family
VEGLGGGFKRYIVMYIKKIIIQNFKCFNDVFELELNSGLNILVGDNESGKSTILEAIDLALSGYINGKYLKMELNESLFNKEVVKQYLLEVNGGKSVLLPSIVIELYCDFDDGGLNAEFEGNNNSMLDRHESGIRFIISFDQEKSNEFIREVKTSQETLYSLPIEYCDFSWETFSRDPKIPRTIPIKSLLIDSSNFRYNNGSDVNASRIIRDGLTFEEETKISQAHRRLKDAFSSDASVEMVNEKIQQNISDKRVSLQIETSTKTSWESSLIPYLDDIPFQNAGKGEQCLVKTKLSLQHKRMQDPNKTVLLLEEPENHLSYSKLNELISYIKEHHKGKQIIISTHNSFVANKLGLENLILLNVDNTFQRRNKFKITDLKSETQEYFKKLPGYDTLRLILCRKAILVEGDSDELIVQKAYLKEKGKIPIEDGVDVISVRSLAFKRFLDIAMALNKPTAVVTDNDGCYKEKIVDNYVAYEKCSAINIFADNRDELCTLEPQIVDANCGQLSVLKEILNLPEGCSDKQSIIEYMEKHKTDYALRIFDKDEQNKIIFPQYILNAVNWAYEKK